LTILISLIVPIYNEINTVEKRLDELIKIQSELNDLEIIVIESNSTDGTKDVLNKYLKLKNWEIIFQDQARGKGNAVRSAFKHVKGRIVAIIDADLEYDLEDLKILIEPILSGKAKFVLGNRHNGTNNFRIYNSKLKTLTMSLAHQFFTFLINFRFRTKLKDPWTMYKVFEFEIIRNIQFNCNRFDFDWELMIRLLQKGISPLEIPVKYTSRDFFEGKKVRFFYDPLTWLIIYFKTFFK
jgi:glycosyltransferase involved in cell wall biosynthesis